MIFKPHELSETFEGGDRLIPPDWVAFLWNEDEDAPVQVHPSSVPKEGEFVALLCDRRIIPSDAITTQAINRLDHTPPATNNLGLLIAHQIFYKKAKIRGVAIARYLGLTHDGYPSFKVLHTDSVSADYMVAWKPLNIPTMNDIEI